MKTNTPERIIVRDSDGGNFSSGFVMGLLAGVTGVFLFGTKKGHKTLARWQKMWEEFQPKLQEGIEGTEESLKKSNRPFFQAVGEIVDYVAEHLKVEKTKGKTTKSLSAPKTKKNTFFSR